jgi:hypothetical protein
MAYCVNGCWTVSNAIGIGTETPSQPIEIRSSQEGLWMYRDGGASNDIRFRSSNGTNASPTAKTNGELMGQLHFEGYDGSSYLSFGGIWSDLDGTVSTGNMPTTLRFFTGTTSRNERMRITSGGNVGIGTTSPGAQFTIQGTGPGSGLQDGQVQIRTTTAANPSAIGFINSGNTPSFNDLAWIRAIITAGNARGSLSFVTRDSDGSNTGVAERMRITNGGSVGIGTSSPSYQLHVNGTFYAAGSSCEYKTSICQYNTDSCMFMKLKPVTYQYKDEWCHLGKDLKSGTQIGLIAEEVAESHPELAVLVNEEDNQVVRNVDYEKLSIILLAEVQKLRQEVDQLNQK